MRAPRLTSKAVAALGALVAALMLWSVPAGAEVTHKYLSSITDVPAEGPKGEPVALPGALSEVNSMTIDEGKLYVAEEFGSFVTSRTDVFDTATHAFVRQFDQPATPIDAAHIGIAVGHATGEPQIYVGALGETSTVVVPFDAEGHQAGSPWVGEDTPAGSFSGHNEGELADVAVDNDATSLLGDWAAGDVFVDTRSPVFHAFPAMNVIDVFEPQAGGKEKYVTQLTGTCASPGVCPGEVVPFNGPSHIVVDPRNGDLLVVDRTEDGKNTVVDMFKPGPLVDQYEFTGGVTGSPQGAFHEIHAIAVDGGEGSLAEGAIYVLEGGTVYQFDSTGQYVGQFATASGREGGIAVDPSTHNVYVGMPAAEASQVKVFGPSLLLPDVTTAPASRVSPESATLNGTVNPAGAKAGETTCRFVWGTSESFGHETSCSAPVAEGESPVPVAAVLEHLEADTTYYYRLQASNANGRNEGETSQTLHFTTPGPGVTEEAVSAVSSTSATLAAKVDPHGTSTTSYVQYGTSTAYGLAIPAAPGDVVGAGEGFVEVAHHLQGLSPNTTYHYRIVAVSDIEVEPGIFKQRTFDGHDRTFTTQGAGGSLVLPDGRAWELVSPADKHGSSIYPLGSPFKRESYGFVQSSASGDSLTYLASKPTDEAAPAYVVSEQVLSKRGLHDWSSQDLALARRAAPGLIGEDFRFFSEDLSLALAEPEGPFTSLVPEATPPDTERTLYLRHNDTCATQPSTCYLPLVTGAPGYADVPPGTVINPNPADQSNSLQFEGATTDLKHVLFLTHVGLTSASAGGTLALYEWAAGKPAAEELQLVSSEIGDIALNILNVNEKDAISGNGSRVIFPAPGGHLDQREMTRDQTVQLDEVQPGASGAGSPSAFLQAANGDGSLVYFTDSQRLTKDSHGVVPDLYECRLVEVAGKEKCSLTDLTPNAGAEGADVESLVLGASEDGAYIYFVAAGVLSDQPNSAGETAVAGGPNLYEIHDGAIELVAVLSRDDRWDWGGAGGHVLESSQETARVSPHGRYLAFMSDRALTGYDNVDVSSGKPDEEVFLFDSNTDRLVCASCNPSGGRPQGLRLDAGVDAAANVPGWTEFASQASLRQPRYLSDSGRLFFDSRDALVPQDVNEEEDVYEYEPAGVGDCSTQSPGYEAGSDGCVGLISSGTARGESTFMEASESGDDVFFLTTERLVGGDTDTAADVYDAHVCSQAAPCSSASASAPPCATADACRAAPSSQPAIFGSPASATFRGAGNLVPKQAQAVSPKSLTQAQKLARALRACRRKAKRKRAACERKAHRQYSSKPAPRARVTKGGRG